MGAICLTASLLVQVAPAAAEDRTAESANQRLIRFYSQPKNYRAVQRDVLRWHGTTRNGCVAFVSTALRHIGVPVPERGARGGYGISRITFSFSDYLEEELGWRRVRDMTALAPGDIVFTTGYPDHVFVFHAWRDRRRARATVIDNRGFRVARNLVPRPGSDQAPFAYALRAPAANANPRQGLSSPGRPLSE